MNEDNLNLYGVYQELTELRRKVDHLLQTDDSTDADTRRAIQAAKDQAAKAAGDDPKAVFNRPIENLGRELTEASDRSKIEELEKENKDLREANEGWKKYCGGLNEIVHKLQTEDSVRVVKAQQRSAKLEMRDRIRQVRIEELEKKLKESESLSKRCGEEISTLAKFMTTQCYGLSNYPVVDEDHPHGRSACETAIAIIEELLNKPDRPGVEWVHDSLNDGWAAVIDSLTPISATVSQPSYPAAKSWIWDVYKPCDGGGTVPVGTGVTRDAAAAKRLATECVLAELEDP